MLGKLSEAIDDCTKAIQLDKTYQKPYLRRGNAYMEIEEFDQAVKDFEQLVKMDLTNIEYNKLLKEAKEKLRLSKKQRLVSASWCGQESKPRGNQEGLQEG